MTVHRFAMRRFDGELVDPADRAEQRRTYFLLEVGALALVRAVFLEALRRPGRWADSPGGGRQDGPALGARV